MPSIWWGFKLFCSLAATTIFRGPFAPFKTSKTISLEVNDCCVRKAFFSFRSRSIFCSALLACKIQQQKKMFLRKISFECFGSYKKPSPLSFHHPIRHNYRSDATVGVQMGKRVFVFCWVSHRNRCHQQTMNPKLLEKKIPTFNT